MNSKLQNHFSLKIFQIFLISVILLIPIHLKGQNGSCNLDNFVTYTQGGWGSKGGKLCEGVTFITVRQNETGHEISKGNGTDKLGANTTFSFPNGESIVIHTSCSQLIYTGMTLSLNSFTYTITQLTTIPSSTNNPGSIRKMYFNEVFPSGLEVGGIYKLKLTTEKDVEKFLPQGGTPKALDKNYINPKSTKAGVFAGQVVALKLNVAFSDAGKIGSGSIKLGELIVNAGPLSGKTVYEVLDLANTALGGGTTPYSITTLNEVVTAINENFEGGNVNKGFLRCPQEPQFGSISGLVFFDVNGDGLFNNSDYGLADIVVRLFIDSTQVGMTTTDASGLYKFSNLSAGNYKVKVDDPPVLQLTNPPNPKNVSLTVGEHKVGINFGYKCPQLLAKISGFVFEDNNQNGIKDNGEAPLANVVIKLYDENSNILSTITTNSNGYYEFTNLYPGIYTIEEIDPDGYRSTTTNYINLILTSGQNSQNNNFGDILSADICGIVFNDINEDGIKQPSEQGIQDVLIELYKLPANELVAQITTGVNGEYCFSYLLPGQYKIKEYNLPNYASTTPDEIVKNISPSDKSYNNNFGDKLIQKGSISGLVWNDLNSNGIREYSEPKLSNIIVKLYDCNNNWIKELYTDINGNYKFDSLDSGTYQILVQLPDGYSFSPANQGSDDSKDSDIDPLTWKSHCISLNWGQNITNIDGGIFANPPQQYCSIGDRVWEDLNKNGIQDSGEPGVPNFTVKLYNSSTLSVLQTKVTDSQGKYLFNDVPAGYYFIKFENLPSGYTFTSKDAGMNDFLDSDVDVLTGKTPVFPIDPFNCDSNSTRWDAGIYYCPPGYEVKGMVFNDVNGNGIKDFDEVGIPNVLIKLWGTSANLIATQLTNSQGKFNFTNVIPGDYHVQEIDLPGYISTTPNSQFITVTSSNITNINFGDKEKPVQEPCDLTKYQTYTQDQWCMEPARSLLLNNFSSVFGSSMIIGDNGSPYTITFTNALSVLTFLPQYDNPASLSMSYINPISTSAGEFAGNVASLALNVAFNDAGLLGHTSTTKLGNLVIASGPMKDYKVYEVLSLANKALGGRITPFSINTLNTVVKMINYNFSCNCNNDFLTCPPPPDSCGGGFDAGVESNANLADLLLQRLTKIEYGMTTKILKNSKASIITSIGLQSLLPPVGPLGSKPVETTPFDILGVSNATSAYAADYKISLAKGDVRVASIFATTTNPPYIYEHTKAICDRLINAELEFISQVKINDHYFFASVLNKTEEGIKDYTIHFSVYEKNGSFIVDSRWLIEEYKVPAGVTNIYNFQVWGSNFHNAIYLTELILEQFESKGNVEYLNNSSIAPTLVYVKKGKYNHNGTIELIINNEQLRSDNVTIKLKSRKVQGGEKIEQVHSYSIQPGINTLVINTGVLSDANIYISSTNGFKDEIFVSGGAYTYLAGQGSRVDEFITNSYNTQDISRLPKETMVLSGGARMRGVLNDWVTMFRSLTANTAPYDLSDYYAIRFTIKGYGKIYFRIEQDGIKNFDFHSKQIFLDGSEQTFTIPLNEFKQLNGSDKLDQRLIRKISLYLSKQDNPNLTSFDIELKDIAFLKKDSNEASNNLLPKEFNLGQNYPNPFNPSTLIEYSVAKPEFVTIKVYNILGKEIATLVNEFKEPGIYSVRFDASELGSGVYIYKLQSDSYTATRKMILQK